ncbi:MAG: response regulator [Campylobacterales bacterium]|nr:response regulator [Campylobacterales bacterium]
MAKILIVDDSNMLRDMVRYALNEGGYADVVEAVDGLDGLEKAKSASFDLVITDINMPNVNGFDLTRQLRSMPAYQKIPILILTTECTDEMKQKGKGAGATGWIVKPFEGEKFIKVVDMYMKG